jgi:hypothetical protein
MAELNLDDLGANRIQRVRRRDERLHPQALLSRARSSTVQQCCDGLADLDHRVRFDVLFAVPAKVGYCSGSEVDIITDPACVPRSIEKLGSVLSPA